MSKPNLPPPSFYQKHEDVCGTEVGPPTPFWNQAAVEEAVRQALAAQETVAWLREVTPGGGVWRHYVSLEEPISGFPAIERKHRLAIIPDDSPGHKPAPVGTSSGHSVPVTGEALTAEAVERQYRDGLHIGSGLPRTTCPCGFCAKHRHGFERGDDLAALQASDRET